ncbi:MAG: MFS transporter, partial [Candidatus Latescibacterota bacterium]
MIVTAAHSRRRLASWALYDWANSAFATTVMAAFFPVFFKEYWNSGVPVEHSSMRLGTTSAVASVAVAVVAPLLGAIADRGRTRKPFLLAFTLLGVATTAALYWVGPGHWLAAAVLFGLGSVAFGGGIVFYDSLLVSVAAPGREDSTSALGYALGYLGGGLLFAANVAMVLSPQTFGLADQGAAVRVAFVSAAAWWLVFAVPLFLFVPEPGG